MKKMNPAVTVLSITVLLLAGCISKPKSPAATADPADGQERLNVVAAIFPPYDFVRTIAGNAVELAMLVPPGSESHSYEPSPQDMIMIQDCDLFIYTGGESDVWMDEMLNSLDTSEIKIVALMDLVDVVEEEIVEGMQEDHEVYDGTEHPEAYDEHVWTSPKNAKLIVAELTQILSDMDQANAADYQQNAQAYLAQLDQLDLEFETIVKQAKRTTIVFGDRFPFRYFADAYHLKYFAAFPGCSTETEPSAATIAYLIDKVNQEQIPVVFHIELSNEKIADTICEASGAQKLLLHTGHNITGKEFAEGITYLELMKGNAERLKQALQ